MHDSGSLGFVVYPTYRIVDDEPAASSNDNDEKKEKAVKDTKKHKKALVYLFGKLKTGESFLTISDFKPYFCIKTSDAKNERLNKVLKDYNASIEETDFKNFDDEPMSKIILRIPADVPPMRKYLEDELQITTFEADIKFPMRFLIDHDIKGTMKITGDYKRGHVVDRIYENPKLEPAEYVPELKVLSIDIETDMKLKHIYCISLYTDDYKKVLIVANEKDMGKPLKNAITLNSEKEMLEKFSELIRKIDPDVITGWNLIDFDLKALKQKFDEHKVPFMIGRIDWPCKVEIQKDFMRDSSADVPGRMVLDGLQLVRTSYVKLESYKLDDVASQILGEKKTIEFEHKGKEIETLYKKDQQTLVDYNLMDSQLVHNIVYKTGAIQLTLIRSLVTGMTLERVKASVASLDSLFLRYARKHKIVLNNSHFSEKEEPGKGGFVMNSKPGIYDWVVVCDFKSLYPSIIRTFNIDPYSYVKPENRPKTLSKDKYVTTANGAVFKNQQGILPQIISEVWKARDLAKKNKDSPETIYALKIIMNSFYGVLSNPACRFYNLDISNAITYTGQEIIKLSAKKVEELGYEVIYSDTDSLFIVSRATNEEDAKKVGKKIQTYINSFYDEYIQQQYHRKSEMEIQFEKLFKVFLMPSIRGSTDKDGEAVGSKKRYAGLIVQDGKEEMSFTGMEFVRGDWTELAKKFQLELFERVFKKKPVDDYIKRFVADLKNGLYDDLLVYKKNISKPLSEYTKTTPPHVKAARMLKVLTTNKISYVVTTHGPEPLELLKHKPDYDHYIQKQIKPIADTILSVSGKSFDEIFKNTTQSSLGDY